MNGVRALKDIIADRTAQILGGSLVFGVTLAQVNMVLSTVTLLVGLAYAIRRWYVQEKRGWKDK